MMWYIGQQVVCIKNGDREAFGRDELMGVPLTVGGVYTIRDIETWGTMVGFRLEEVNNLIHPGGTGETVYDDSLFRPVRKTDISVFQKLLLTRELESA